jgi:probable phosphoglycerate mutase
MMVYLVRHGESVSNVGRYFPDEDNPSSLTETGHRQAAEIADVISKLNVQMVFSSPMLRTRETAQHISNKLGVEVQVASELREVGLGKLAGRKYPEVLSEDPMWYMEYFDSTNRYGLEKFGDVVKRVSSFIERISPQADSAVLVSHVEPIRAAVCACLGAHGSWVRRLRISNASITVVHYAGGRFRLGSVNWLPATHYVNQFPVQQKG